jgi:uncharacterized membrane-anchored protein
MCIISILVALFAMVVQLYMAKKEGAYEPRLRWVAIVLCVIAGTILLPAHNTQAQTGPLTESHSRSSLLHTGPLL